MSSSPRSTASAANTVTTDVMTPGVSGTALSSSSVADEVERLRVASPLPQLEGVGQRRVQLPGPEAAPRDRTAPVRRPPSPTASAASCSPLRWRTPARSASDTTDMSPPGTASTDPLSSASAAPSRSSSRTRACPSQNQASPRLNGSVRASTARRPSRSASAASRSSFPMKQRMPWLRHSRPWASDDQKPGRPSAATARRASSPSPASIASTATWAATARTRTRCSGSRSSSPGIAAVSQRRPSRTCPIQTRFIVLASRPTRSHRPCASDHVSAARRLCCSRCTSPWGSR